MGKGAPYRMAGTIHQLPQIGDGEALDILSNLRAGTK